MAKRQSKPASLNNLKPWKKGQSGNPNGRPKRILPRLEDVLRECLGSLSEEDQEAEIYKIVKALIKEAKASGPYAKNVSAAQLLIERAFPIKKDKDPNDPPPTVSPAIVNIITSDDKIKKLLADKEEKLKQNKTT